MVEKIHLEGKQIEQKGASCFVWLLKAYGSLGGRGFSRLTAIKGLSGGPTHPECHPEPFPNHPDLDFALFLSDSYFSLYSSVLHGIHSGMHRECIGMAWEFGVNSAARPDCF